MNTRTYYPLYLSYNSEDGDRSWVLSFKETPEREISFSGDLPTRDELVECLATIPGLPLNLLRVFEIILANEIRKKELMAQVAELRRIVQTGGN